MPVVRIGPKHQITVPKEVVESLRLAVGDFLEVKVQDGKGIIIPKNNISKAPVPALTTREQRLWVSAKRKISAIQKNLRTAKGLTEAEAVVAAKIGLVDPSQRWWWTETWQKGEREAQQDIEEGRVSKAYDNAAEAIKHLKSRT